VRLDKIEESVNGLKMPLAYADQFYVLREHIGFVRARLTRDSDAAAAREASDAAGAADKRAAADEGPPAVGRAEARSAMHESHAAQEHHDNPDSHQSHDSDARPGGDRPAHTS
jgi:hypothetical protein